MYDQLTALSNRVLFYDRLDHGIAHATPHGSMLAVIFVDLNEFKSVNDIYGHQAGDVFKSVALQLTHTTRQENAVTATAGMSLYA